MTRPFRYYAIGERAASKFFRLARFVIFFITDSLLLALRPPKTDIALIVRLDAIGDAAVWFQSGAGETLEDLRRTHSQVILLANSNWAELAIALEVFDQVVPISPSGLMRNLIYRAKVLSQIRLLGAKTILQPRAAKVFLQEDSIVRTSGCRERIGIQGIAVNMSARILAFSNTLYSRIIDPDITGSVHEAVRNQAFADKFSPIRGRPITPLKLAATFQPVVSQEYFVVAPGAGAAGRQWPIEKFAGTCAALQSQFGLKCVVVGAADDQKLADQLKHFDFEFLDLTGKLTLSQTTAVILRCQLLVANESGLFHIAQWAKRPVVGIVGGGHFGWFAPYPTCVDGGNGQICFERMPCYNCNWNCIYDFPRAKPFPCVAGVTTDIVTEKCVSILGERK
jgi:ADP-heptose:LPS heptosyltransferase